MIDKISSWKYAENFNREPDHISVARNSAEQLGVESVTPATGAGLASIAAMLGAKNIVEVGTGAGVQLLPQAIGLVRPSGAIVISHALWRDRVPNPALRDDETSAMRAVVRFFEESDEFISSISMLGDGLLVAVRKPEAIS